MKKILGDIRLMVKCCILYYEEDLGQQEIAKLLGISRPTVSRLLKEAKESGIVKIEINRGFQSDYQLLERKLEKHLGLKEVIIVEDKLDAAVQKLELANAAAKYLERTIADGDVVGVSMGTTIKEIAQYVKNTNTLQVTFVPLIGGVGQVGIDIHPNQIVLELAKAFGGKFSLLHAPAVISDIGIKANLQKEKGIKHILQHIQQTNIAVVGIGVPTDKRSTMMATGYYDEQDMKSLKEKKAVGDICLQFYDIRGNTEPFEFNERVFGIEIAQLKSIDKVIGVAGGEEKAQAILGAVHGKYINVLVTNYSCGKKLLK
ncbi:DNA-binding transcriptional regulator LsrR, DeoR family [Geosporobacter subterraneus DSM 17957]|uniref:DNA-binding transcriptional regulator LsrR, DeoR family n=1 Tax=Geosporobacter subterraneus DSM 17957 TaxID=1121919 RepID=A0A1M6IQJ6_9FIRM|nr:sugar-binding transcriptional regulator [Geosporobacter subterraneus]SHJ36685.1 DNA-binding transcriptional regulator LsrR, DeoR family [Geosporobacter subterraneus DSM 17957]